MILCRCRGGSRNSIQGGHLLSFDPGGEGADRWPWRREGADLLQHGPRSSRAGGAAVPDFQSLFRSVRSLSLRMVIGKWATGQVAGEGLKLGFKKNNNNNRTDLFGLICCLGF
jgi:hypothetical protein